MTWLQSRVPLEYLCENIPIMVNAWFSDLSPKYSVLPYGKLLHRSPGKAYDPGPGPVVATLELLPAKCGENFPYRVHPTIATIAPELLRGFSPSLTVFLSRHRFG